MAAAPSQTTFARIAMARENEDLVRAEAAWNGERMVCVVRVAAMALRMVGLVAGGQVLYPEGSAGRDPRAGVGALYLIFAVGILILYSRKPRRYRVRRAALAPLVYNLCDFGFATWMAIASYRRGDPANLDWQAITCAVFLCFSVVRVSWKQVVQSTVFALAAFAAAVVWNRPEGAPLNSGSLLFVSASLLGLGLLMGWMNVYLRSMFMGLRRRDNLSRFLPQQLVAEIEALGEAALAPVQAEVTVLFVDIRDFTRLSEKLAPREVLQFLDEFFGHLSQIVKAHQGIVNKFLGDGMLAFWGIPKKEPRHAELALLAVLDIRKKLVEYNQHRVQLLQPPIRIGMGVHTGLVAAGMLGGADQHEYTVIGDAVNVASRVEGLNKSYQTDALVSETTWNQAGPRFRGERRGEDKLKGREEAVVVYSVADAGPAGGT